MEKEMDVPEGAWCKSSHSVLWVAVLFGIRVSWVCQGPAELPGSRTLLQVRDSHHGMGVPREGFCRDLADSVVPDH